MIFSATLHHVNDDEDPAGLVRFWYDRIPSGSYVFISHFRSENDPRSQELEQVLQGSLGRGRWRTDEQILALFGDGFTVLEPGLVPGGPVAQPGRPGRAHRLAAPDRRRPRRQELTSPGNVCPGEEGELRRLRRAVRVGDLGFRAEGEAGAAEAVDGAGVADVRLDHHARMPEVAER